MSFNSPITHPEINPQAGSNFTLTYAQNQFDTICTSILFNYSSDTDIWSNGVVVLSYTVIRTDSWPCSRANAYTAAAI